MIELQLTGLDSFPKMPKEGEEYRHFKGNVYKVIRIFKSFAVELEDGQTSSFYSSLIGRVDYTAASSIRRNEPIVFYQGADSRVWARSLSNFQEVLGDEVEHRYPRFELIEEGDRTDSSSVIRAIAEEAFEPVCQQINELTERIESGLGGDRQLTPDELEAEWDAKGADMCADYETFVKSMEGDRTNG